MSFDPAVPNNGGVLDWISSFVFSEKTQNYADLRSKEFFLKSALQTVGNLGYRTLRWLETDDPETTTEKIAFDRLEHQLRTAADAMAATKASGGSRRPLVERYLTTGPYPPLSATDQQVLKTLNK